MENLAENYVLVSGFALTPKGTPLNEAYKYIGVTLIVNKKNNCIIESHFTVVSPLTNKVLKDLVNGYCITEPFENLTNKLKEHMCIPSLGAILQAISAAFERYKDIIK